MYYIKYPGLKFSIQNIVQTYTIMPWPLEGLIKHCMCVLYVLTLLNYAKINQNWEHLREKERKWGDLFLCIHLGSCWIKMIKIFGAVGFIIHFVVTCAGTCASLYVIILTKTCLNYSTWTIILAKISIWYAILFGTLHKKASKFLMEF